MKIKQHIIIAALAALSVSAPSFAAEHTLVAGAAKTQVDSAPQDLYGFNVKYRYDGNARLGFIASATLTGRSKDNLLAANGQITTTQTMTYGYGSITAGPVYRLNPVLSVYSTVGYGGYFIEVEDKITNTKRKTVDEQMLAASVGIQANITRRFLLDANYEYVPFSGNNDAGTFMLGLGYSF